MISLLSIKAFKSFPQREIILKPLTLLTGLNNCGKSSLIQAIRMFVSASKGNHVFLDGHGQIKEIKSKLSSFQEKIEITTVSDSNVANSLFISEDEVIRPQSSPHFIYIGADRLGPQTFLPLHQDSGVEVKPEIGDIGEYVIDYIQKLSECIIPKSLHHVNSEGQTLEYVLRGWLTEIAPGVDINLFSNVRADISHADFDGFRPKNVGFGLSYTLPIIAAVLGAVAERPANGWIHSWGEKWSKEKEDNGCLLILENPEAHLHPQGQTAIGKLISLASSCGVQVIVETHSDHLMDGIRIAAKEQIIDNESIIFHYLSKNSSGETEMISPSIDKNGKLDKWPEGFFDQTVKNKAVLAKKGA